MLLRRSNGGVAGRRGGARMGRLGSGGAGREEGCHSVAGTWGRGGQTPSRARMVKAGRASARGGGAAGGELGTQNQSRSCK